MTHQQMRDITHPSFRFIVEIGGERQAAFTECSLPTLEWDIEEVKEGGLNTFVHQLPGQRKAARLTLKNGIGKTKLFDWYFQGLSEKFTRKSVTITLLDAQRKAVIAWNIEDAYPVKWAGPQLKPDENTIAIQTLEIACGYISVS